MKPTNSIIITILFLITFLAITSNAQNADSRPLTTVTGEAEIWVVPDEAIIVAGVETWHEKIDEAVKQTDDVITNMLELADRYNLEQRDIQTNHINIAIKPRRIKDNSKHGFMVRKMVTYKLKDMSVLDGLLSDIVKAGANTLHDVSFRTSEIKKYRDEAYLMAIRAAREKAARLSEELDQTIGKAYKIREGARSQKYMDRKTNPFNASVEIASPDDNVSTTTGNTVALGQIRISASVGVDFELK